MELTPREAIEVMDRIIDTVGDTELTHEEFSVKVLLATADEMAQAVAELTCNLDPAQSGCSVPCHLCPLLRAGRAAREYLDARKVAGL